MQVSLAPNRDVEIIIFLGLVCALLFDLRTQHINATHTKTHIQWNLSVTTTSTIKIIACDLFSNVF